MILIVLKIYKNLFKLFFLYNKVIVLIFCSFIFITCIGSNKVNSAEGEIVKQKEELISDSNNIIKNIKLTEVDIIQKKNEAINFLKSKGIISPNYPNNKAISYKEIDNDGVKYCLLKMNYDKSLGNKFSFDPVINILFIKKKNNLIDRKIFYTIEERDFSFNFNHKKVPFFEYYAGAPGWIKYHAYLIDEKIFIETRRLDTNEELNKDSIKLNSSLTYKVKNSKKLEKFVIGHGSN